MEFPTDWLPFALFAGDDYENMGGWSEYVGSFATLEEAKQSAPSRDDWVEIVDLRSKEIVSTRNHGNWTNSK